MTMLDQIGQDKQRISERLMRLDVERTKLSDQLNELEIAERALKRFGGNGVATEKRKRGRAAKPATAAGAKPRAGGGQQVRSASSLGEATLKAVQAHAKDPSGNKRAIWRIGIR